MSPLERITHTLQSPILVARIQKFFGIDTGNSCIHQQQEVSFYNSQNSQKIPSKPVRRRRRTSSLQDNGDNQHLIDGDDARNNSSLQILDICKSSSSTTSHSDNRHQEPPEYVIRNLFWYYLFSFGASLGYEVFYATFFPIWFWNIDSAVGRRMILLWVTIMYVGQALKDLIRMPRPSSPPVVSLEPDYVMEYGMPSTHAMVGIALPLSLVIFTNNRYEYPVWVGITAAVMWCLLVCGSRLYLGMHSILDIVAGLVLSGIMMLMLVPLVDVAADWLLTNPYAPVVTIIVILAMSIFYPKSDRWSPARGDTSVITGSGAGILMGSWLNYQLGIIQGPPLEPPFPILWPGVEVAALAVCRAVIGIVCVLSSRVVGKLIGLNFLSYLRGLDMKDPSVRKRVSVEVPHKLITYVGLGITITFLSPSVFRRLGIERETMFTEV